MSGVGDSGWEMSCVPCPMSHVPHPTSHVLYPPSHVPCPTSPIPPLTGEQAEDRDAAALHGGQFGDVGDPLESCIRRARPPPWFQRLLRFWGNCGTAPAGEAPGPCLEHGATSTPLRWGLSQSHLFFPLSRGNGHFSKLHKIAFSALIPPETSEQVLFQPAHLA